MLFYRDANQDGCDAFADRGQKMRFFPVVSIKIFFEYKFSIDDPTLKLQVILLLQHNKRLKNQLDILQQVEGKPQVRLIETDGKDFQPVGVQKAITGDINLTSQEKMALNQFTDKKQMAYRGYQWTEHGALKLGNGEMVGKPGLLSALQKLQGQEYKTDSA
jgi:hypothetical protein